MKSFIEGLFLVPCIDFILDCFYHLYNISSKILYVMEEQKSLDQKEELFMEELLKKYKFRSYIKFIKAVRKHFSLSC